MSEYKSGQYIPISPEIAEEIKTRLSPVVTNLYHHGYSFPIEEMPQEVYDHWFKYYFEEFKDKQNVTSKEVYDFLKKRLQSNRKK